MSAILLMLQMEKKPDEPPAQRAPAVFLAELQDRARLISNLDWDAVLVEAIPDRTTRWRFSKGTASMSTARKVEQMIDDQAKARGQRVPDDRDLLLVEWRELGHRLMAADPDKFDEILTIVRAQVAAAEGLRKVMMSGLDSPKK